MLLSSTILSKSKRRRYFTLILKNEYSNKSLSLILYMDVTDLVICGGFVIVYNVYNNHGFDTEVP